MTEGFDKKKQRGFGQKKVERIILWTGSRVCRVHALCSRQNSFLCTYGRGKWEYLMNLIQKYFFYIFSCVTACCSKLACGSPLDRNHHSHQIFEEEIQCGGNEPKAFVVWTSRCAVQCSKWCGCIFANIKFCLRCSSIAVWLLRNNWNESATSLCCVLSIVGFKNLLKNVLYDIWPPLLLGDHLFLPLK